MQLRRRRDAGATPGRRIRKLRLAVLLVMLFALSGASFTYGLVTALGAEIETLDPTNRRGDVDSIIYAAPPAGGGEKRVLATIRGDESRVLVTSDDIAPIMKQAVVAIEDRRFYEHNGVDVRGIFRALWQDVRSKAVVEGGSTITQQYVKNAYARNERTLGRKVREAALAWQLERQPGWTKDRILTAYLNTIYFGNGAYGIQRAAQTYFGKTAKELTLPEAALLAGMLTNPARYDPVQHPVTAKARRDYVLGLLHDEGRITVTQRKRARHAPLPPPESIRLPVGRGPAPFFTNYVKDQLIAVYGAERVFGGGLAVTTTIDLAMQEKAAKAIGSVLPSAGGLSAALVAIDPRDGSVKAMYGGANYRRSQFNLATQAERQPGSSFKPIVLATALRKGVAPATVFASKPVDIDAGDRIWHVTNYESSYLGQADLATAMVHSDNAVYAQLTKFVDPKAIVDTAHALGVRSDLPAYFSIGLGAVAVNPLDMARAYATIANGGKRVDGSISHDRARVFSEVTFRKSGRTRENRAVPVSALTASEAGTVTRILEAVVAEGTGRRAQLAGHSEAGKTGTTDNYGDAWFVGYTPELVVAVWVGYPNELKPMLTEFNGEPVAGSTIPALIWKAFMAKALPPVETRGFDLPPSLPYEQRRVVWRDGSWKLDNGICPGTRRVAYVVGRAPRETATCYPNEVSVPLVIGRSVSTASATLNRVPLDPVVILIPAKAGKHPGEVMNQQPRGGFASSGSSVKLFVSHAQHGLMPNLVGSELGEVEAQLSRLRLRRTVTYAQGPAGTILRQSLEPGVAVVPGLRVTMVVGRG
ncbi:MAG: PBP1A family penicillin-binding protein [Gaiellales bacterium]